MVCFLLILALSSSLFAASYSSLSPTPLRVVHFPQDRVVGSYSLLEEGLARPRDPFRSHASAESEYAGLARGDAVIPAGKRVRLWIYTNAVLNLSHLAGLGPEDLHALVILDAAAGEQSLPPLVRFTGLKVLDLQSTRITDSGLRHVTALKSLEYLILPRGISDTGLSYAAQLPRLKGLYLKGNRVSNDGLRCLARLRSLEELELGGQYIGDAGLAHLAGLPKLNYLLLWGTNFTGSGFVHLRKVPSLRVVYSFRMAAVQDASLEHLAALPNLESLSLFHNPAISDRGMALLAKSRSLRKLNIDQTQVTPQGVAELMRINNWEYLDLPPGMTDETLTQLGQQQSLKYLSVSASGCTEKGVAALTSLRQLEELHLGGHGVTDAAASHLARMTSLKHLSLIGAPLSNAGLARLTNLKSLEKLHLQGRTRITLGGLTHLNAFPHLASVHTPVVVDDGARLDIGKLAELKDSFVLNEISGGTLEDEDLACFEHLHQLRSLQLSPRTVGDAGLAHLRGMTNLHILNVGGPRVTDHGLAHLTGMKQLSNLWLTGDISDAGLRHLENLESLMILKLQSSRPITPAAIQRLRQALPLLGNVTIEMAAFKPLPPTKPLSGNIAPKAAAEANGVMPR